MEHEDKSPAPIPPPPVGEASGGRTRVESAATEPGDAAERRTHAPSASAPSASAAAAPAAAAPAADAAGGAAPPRSRKPSKKGAGSHPNNVRRLRIERMMSKAELARRANVSVLTIDRVEKGHGCRMDTKRKILEALGLTLADRVRVFGDDE